MTYSGASDRTDFYTSINYLKEDGYIQKSDFERFTGRININTQATDWLKTGINLSATMSDGNNARAGGGSSFVNPFFFTRGMAPIYPVYAYDPASPGSFLKLEMCICFGKNNQNFRLYNDVMRITKSFSFTSS